MKIYFQNFRCAMMLRNCFEITIKSIIISCRWECCTAIWKIPRKFEDARNIKKSNKSIIINNGKKIG